MLAESALRAFALLAVGLPAIAFVVLGIWMFLGPVPSERSVGRLASVTFVTAFFSACALVFATWGASGAQVIALGHLFAVDDYSFELSFVLDHLSVTMLVLTSAICGLIGRFSVSYMHREPGFRRFFMLLFLFAAAMSFLVLSGGLDQLFLGWELVGFSSWLLVAYFWRRQRPVENGLRAFVTYRACDAGLLLGVALLHHFAHGATLEGAQGAVHYPLMAGHVETWQATLVVLCLLLAAMGKSAQFPFSGWLPRAMEGPTPSSALFYGALSVHAGAYLLLRAEPLLEMAPLARVVIVAVGVVTAVMATFSARVQSDIKSALGYAVITQTGMIFVEIGLGWNTLALVHMATHACLRTLQLLRAPSALAAAREIHALSSGTRFATGAHYERIVPASLQRAFYRAALERFYLDVLLERVIVVPLTRFAEAVVRFEHRYSHLQTHTPTELDEQAPTPTDTPVSHATREQTR